MRRPRFVAVLIALAVASTGAVNTAVALRECPIAYVAERPFGTCRFTGLGGSCERCQFECVNGTFLWNVCEDAAGSEQAPGRAAASIVSNKGSADVGRR